jgi:adenosine deaminase
LIVGPTLRWREHSSHSPEEALDSALSYMDRGIVGFSLASESKEGDLILRTDSQIRKAFVDTSRRAKDAGLFLTVHAGEVSGAKSVWDAIQILKADRIGHGIGAIKEKKVLRHVIDGKIPLETCPTSNVLTQAVPSLEKHPIKTLYDMGAIVTINTDDPTLCNTTLTKEYMSMVKTFHLNLLDIKKLLQNSLASAFLANEEKEKLSKSFSAEFFYGLE